MTSGFTDVMLPAAVKARQQWQVRRSLVTARRALLAREASARSQEPWQVRRAVPTVGDVTVAVVAAGAREAVLKCARSRSGRAGLRRSLTVIEELASDERLAGWHCLLPRQIDSWWTPDGTWAVLEDLMPGVDGARAARQRSGTSMQEEVLRAVSMLHRRTGAATRAGHDLLAGWVDAPVELLQRWSDGRGARARQRADALERLRAALRSALDNRLVPVGWIHGDLAPSNVLLDPATMRVRGVVDWERAQPAGLQLVDVVHLDLSTRVLLQRRELGDLVCHRLLATPPAPWSVQSDRCVVLLTWLHHVSGLAEKSGRYTPGGLWAHRNVDPVLALVQSGGAERLDCGDWDTTEVP